jgi:hypothetical protein
MAKGIFHGDSGAAVCRPYGAGGVGVKKTQGWRPGLLFVAATRLEARSPAGRGYESPFQKPQ